MRATEPDLRIELHDLTTEEMMAGLRAGSLDAALAVKPRAGGLRGLMFEKLREDPLVVVVGREHRLAGRRSVALTELVAEPFVIFSRQEYPEHVEGMRELLGGPTVQLRIAEECDSGMSLFAAIEAGLGISILSNSLESVIGTRLKLIPLRHRTAAKRDRARVWREIEEPLGGTGAHRSAGGGETGVTLPVSRMH